MNDYFFDTYALHEISQKGENYAAFVSDVGIVTTKLNLMELYYSYVAKDELETAERLFERFRQFCVNVDDDTLKKAMRVRARLKRDRKGSNFSYVDCIGYVMAKKLKVKFLTGDREFEGLDNVEFVK